MRLLAVNAGMPRTVQWHGRQVTTAISKHPVEGPRPAGDGSAGTAPGVQVAGEAFDVGAANREQGQ